MIEFRIDAENNKIILEIEEDGIHIRMEAEKNVSYKARDLLNWYLNQWWKIHD